MKKITFGLGLVGFIFTSSSFAAQTGGNYVPPSGSQFSEFSVNLNVDCQASPPAVTGSIQNISQLFAATNPAIDGGQIDLLSGQLTEASTDSSSKIQLGGNTVMIRADQNSEWINFGTFSLSDVQTYCAAHAVWVANPNGNPPSSILPLQLAPGVSVSISRSAEWSLCFSNIEDGSSERVLDYTIQISNSQGNSETLKAQKDLIFSSSAQCRNWVEAPWVSQ